MKTELQSNGYEQMLLNLVPRLHEFDSKGGAEGNAYFVDENFVVKDYTDSVTKDVAKCFNDYCMEINAFNSLGFCVPKIYAWLALPNFKGEYKLYMLQQRAKGKQLYPDEILEETYNLCSDFCSEQQFKQAIKQQEGSLYSKIVLTFANQFLTTTKQLEAIDTRVLENFLISDYGMLAGCKYSWPDMQAPNVMFDGKNPTIIDLSFVDEPMDRWTDEDYRVMVMKDIFVTLSDCNPFVGFEGLKVPQDKQVKQLLEENKKVAAAAFLKFVKNANKLFKPNFKKEMDYNICEDIAEEVLSETDATKVLGELEIGF